MSLEPWKVLESTYIHPRFRIDRCELPNGKFLDGDNGAKTGFIVTAEYNLFVPPEGVGIEN